MSLTTAGLPWAAKRDSWGAHCEAGMRIHGGSCWRVALSNRGRMQRREGVGVGDAEVGRGLSTCRGRGNGYRVAYGDSCEGIIFGC